MKADVQKIYAEALDDLAAKLKTAVDDDQELFVLYTQLQEHLDGEKKRINAVQQDDLNAFLVPRKSEFDAHRKSRAALRDGLQAKPEAK